METYLDAFKRRLFSQRYSIRTRESYAGILKVFFRFTGYKNPREFKLSDVIRFNEEYLLKQGYSSSYQNQLINALKLFYRWHSRIFLKLDELERPKKPTKLPVILSKDEIRKLLENTTNLKHLTILSIIYACGLRISEAVNLRIRDIDSERMIVHIRQGKGHKDRITALSPKILELLRKYYLQYRPKDFLFEGQKKPSYSTRSVQMIIKRSCLKAGIQKNVTVHSLRHSYATHLVESGVDVAHVQKLLGHEHQKTTQIYLHLSKQFYKNISSPFESLDLNP